MTLVADCGLEDMTDYFMPRRRIIWDSFWTWQIRRKDLQVTGRWGYALGMKRHTFYTVGVG